MKGSRLSLVGLALCSLALSISSCGSKKGAQPSTTALQSRADSVAYAFGLLNAEGFKARALGQEPISSLDKGMMVRAFEHALKGEPTHLSATQAEKVFKSYLEHYEEELASKAKAVEDSVLQANKGREGFQVTESGLQWRAIRSGEGAKPSEQDTVVVHYLGKLYDGKEFDNSYKRGEPARFSLSRVVPGWREAVMLMSKGAKYELMIPSALAYGARGAGNEIPPYSPLIFEIELLDIVPAQAEEEQPALEDKVETQVSKAKSSSQKRGKSGK